MTERPLEERVSVLEEKVLNQGKQDDETIVLVKDLSRKLVEHIEVEGKRDLRNDIKVDNIEVVVKETRNDIKHLTAISTESREELITYRATLRTIAKAVAVILFVSSAAWGLFEYLDRHGTHIQIVQDK